MSLLQFCIAYVGNGKHARSGNIPGIGVFVLLFNQQC